MKKLLIIVLGYGGGINLILLLLTGIKEGIAYERTGDFLSILMLSLVLIALAVLLKESTE